MTFRCLLRRTGTSSSHTSITAHRSLNMWSKPSLVPGARLVVTSYFFLVSGWLTNRMRFCSLQGQNNPLEDIPMPKLHIYCCLQLFTSSCPWRLQCHNSLRSAYVLKDESDIGQRDPRHSFRGVVKRKQCMSRFIAWWAQTSRNVSVGSSWQQRNRLRWLWIQSHVKLVGSGKPRTSCRDWICDVKQYKENWI